MSKHTKNGKANKIKKKKIWPSIVVLVVSVYMVIVLLDLAMFVFIENIVMDNIESNQERLNAITKVWFQEYEENGIANQSLSDALKKAGYNEDYALLDKNQNVLDSRGALTYDWNSQFETDTNASFINEIDEEEKTGIEVSVTDGDVPNGLSIETNSKEVNVVLDQYTDTHFKADGSIDFGLLEMIGKLFTSQSDIKEDLWGEYDVIISLDYWLRADLTDDGYVLLLKQNLEVTRYHLRYMIIMMVGIVLCMILPIIFFFVNVLSAIKTQKNMTKLLYVDSTTGGKNWLYFRHQAEKILTRKKNSSKRYVVADIELDKYRSYCTCHGIAEGEKLLSDMEAILEKYIGKGECFAHYGKANYGVLICDDKEEDAVTRINKLIEALPIVKPDHKLTFIAGIYTIEPEYNEEKKRYVKRQNIDVDKYYNNASAARASIQDSDNAVLVEFNQSMLDTQVWEHKVEDMMETALENEEFVVYVQPKYNPSTKKLTGAEALVRWIHPTEGFVPPGRFIPIFERNGFITKLDDYMLDHVAKLQAEWIEKGLDVVPVSVNVSRANFTEENLAEHICEIIDRHNVPHKFIEIELTESAFFDDKAMLLNTVNKLKSMGFEISMDDFGAGYSSLNSLKDLPLDVLKLDAEFFRGDEDERGQIVVTEAIKLAKALNMRTVAEGVEKVEQVEFLAKQNCDMIQGFYFSKPLPADEYESRLKTDR